MHHFGKETFSSTVPGLKFVGQHVLGFNMWAPDTGAEKCPGKPSSNSIASPSLKSTTSCNPTC